MQNLGCHFLLEVSGCPYNKLNDTEYVERSLLEAAKRAGATVVTSTFHTFNPHGVSGVVVIAESHIAIHTWPEKGYAAIDVFTCGTAACPEKAVEYCTEAFGARTHTYVKIKRGIIDDRSENASCFLSFEESCAPT